MPNPYAVMYDAMMDVYRWADVTEGSFTKKQKTLIATERPCRYSSKGQVATGIPNPAIVNSHQLFCDISEDVQEGDELVVTMRTGKTVKVALGECHPYTFQWQCEIKREDNA